MDGANRYGGVAPDGEGNFYVATDAGGRSNNRVDISGGKHNLGTVFRLDT
jgi:hypothetical protein